MATRGTDALMGASPCSEPAGTTAHRYVLAAADIAGTSDALKVSFLHRVILAGTELARREFRLEQVLDTDDDAIQSRGCRE